MRASPETGRVAVVLVMRLELCYRFDEKFFFSRAIDARKTLLSNLAYDMKNVENLNALNHRLITGLISKFENNNVYYISIQKGKSQK